MTKNEDRLIKLIRKSDDPEKVESYMLNLFSDFLRISLPSQETPLVDLREFA
jgi:hypothetical protein